MDIGTSHPVRPHAAALPPFRREMSIAAPPAGKTAVNRPDD